jgi:hypothetical protein
VGIRCADHAKPLYPQKLALTSPTRGGRSVGIVRLRTTATEFSSFSFYCCQVQGKIIRSMSGYWVNEINRETRHCGACHSHFSQKQMNDLNPQHARAIDRFKWWNRSPGFIQRHSSQHTPTPLLTLHHSAHFSAVACLTAVCFLFRHYTEPGFWGRGEFWQRRRGRSWRRYCLEAQKERTNNFCVDTAVRVRTRSMELLTTKQSNHGWN